MFCGRNPPRPWPTLWVGAVMPLIGCLPPPKPMELTRLEEKVDQLTAEKQRLGSELGERDGRIEALKKKIEECQERGPNPLASLFRPTRLEIADRTGGADYDGKPGDDGVTVYLRPLDEDGHAVKAPGEIQIILYDLTDPGHPREIGSYVVNEPAVLRKSWYSGWMTNHYTIKCAWPPGVQPPASREVLIRASFVDAVTGDKLVATKEVKVEWVNRP